MRRERLERKIMKKNNNLGYFKKEIFDNHKPLTLFEEKALIYLLKRTKVIKFKRCDELCCDIFIEGEFCGTIFNLDLFRIFLEIYGG